MISKFKEYKFALGLMSEEKKIIYENSSLIMHYNHNYDDAGLILRTGQGLYICLVEKSKLDVMPYSDFVAHKNKRFIKIRFKDKLNETGIEKQARLREGGLINQISDTKSDITEFLALLKSRYVN